MTGRLPFEALPGHPSFVRLEDIDGIAIDLRYAGANNVFGQDVHAGLDCRWLHVDAARALALAVAHVRTQTRGERLLVLDALRPQRVQQRLWDTLTDPSLRGYLADPARGSIHSYGLAVDVTLIDAQGREIDMGTGFDVMTPLSHPEFEAQHLATGQLSPMQVAARERLREAMLHAGFNGVRHEWWHFDLHDREHVRATGLRVE